MSTAAKKKLTPQEYLEIERAAEYKSEFYDGEMFPLHGRDEVGMAGASREHNLLVANLVSEAHRALRDGPCEVYPSDMRVKVDETGIYTYPDVAIVCGEPQFEDGTVDTLLNPTALIEVLSPSTENYDRGKKSGHYRRLPSLKEYLLVSQDQPHVEHYARQDDGDWLLSEATGLDAAIRLPTVDAELPLADIYARVKFEPGA